MNRIIEKLTSRKFWMALAGFVSMMMIARGKTESEAAQVSALIMAGASVVAYIVGEGLADAAGVGQTTVVFPEYDNEEDDLK